MIVQFVMARVRCDISAAKVNGAGFVEVLEVQVAILFPLSITNTNLMKIPLFADITRAITLLRRLANHLGQTITISPEQIS